MSYESDFLRNVYLLFHYGTPEEILDGIGLDASAIQGAALHFPEATVEFFQPYPDAKRALDLGCAVGKSSLVLSKSIDEVIGIDFSQNFVDAAETIRSEGKIDYLRYREAHLSEKLTTEIPENARPEAVSFEQGDAMHLRLDLGSFDLVHAANLLCRLPEPLRFLNRLSELVAPDGQLVLATPCTWLEEFTPRENQPTGPTLDLLHEHLDADFELQKVEEIPFLIREHVRKFQLSTSQTSLWRRKT
ncbi:MAG: methyltransferase domain-containing protein [Verrucomicrobiales bacterium]|nr:methyltransferase domain-containing protein [Verrucomicrobiales bacterium]